MPDNCAQAQRNIAGDLSAAQITIFYRITFKTNWISLPEMNFYVLQRGDKWVSAITKYMAMT